MIKIEEKYTHTPVPHTPNERKCIGKRRTKCVRGEGGKKQNVKYVHVRVAQQNYVCVCICGNRFRRETTKKARFVR